MKRASCGKSKLLILGKRVNSNAEWGDMVHLTYFQPLSNYSRRIRDFHDLIKVIVEYWRNQVFDNVNILLFQCSINVLKINLYGSPILASPQA